MPLPTPTFYLRAEAKRAREATNLLAKHNGDYHAAADEAWARMDSETNGTRANYWGEVFLVIQQREAEAR